jgi:hypothetical protein
MTNSDLYKYEIVHLNIRGARSNKENLEHYLAEMDFPEIVCLNETKLPLNKNFGITGYNVATRREHNTQGGSRGSLILSRQDIKDIVEIEEVKDLFKHDEVVGIEIKSNSSRPGLKVFTYYNPPLCSPNEAILRYVSACNGSCVITGDLNCKNTIWGSTKNDRRGIELLEMLGRSNLNTFNDDSKTRCDPGSGKEESLDIVAGNTKAARLFRDFWVGVDVGSDHYPLHTTLQFKNKGQAPPIMIRRIEKMNHKKWENQLNEQQPLQPSRTASELDSNAELMTKRIMSAFENSCPETRINKSAKCKFTLEIKACVKEKRKLRRQKNEALQNNDQALVRQLMSRINKLGNDIKKLQKQEKKNELLRHCSRLNTENNPKKFFETFSIIANPILKNEPPASKMKPVIDELGTTASTSQEKVTLFASRLQRIHQEPDWNGFDNTWKENVEHFLEQNENAFKTKRDHQYLEAEEGDDSTLLQTVSLEELQENLVKCKNRSAAGKDGVSYSMIKKLPQESKQGLCQLYSDAIRLGHFPTIWKSALVKMLPKPQKDSKQAKNYRPISLLSCLGKVLERILAWRISTYLEAKKLLSTTQSGFRSHRMTAEQLLRLSEESHIAFKKHQTVAAVFLDAEAAFDRCWHNGIRYKLKKNMKLPNRITRLLSSFITGRTLTVFYEGCLSQVVHLNAGTPQGSPLSPLIYIIYVNDYPESIQQKCSLAQFADDTALWAAAYTRAFATRKIQTALNSLEGWCRRWRVKLNGEKSKLLFISRTRKTDNENYCLQLFDDIIRPVEGAKFLGVEIDSTLSFKNHFESVCNKSSKRLNVLKVLAKAGVEPQILMRLYKCYICSLFEYGCPSFIAAPKNQMARLQLIQNDAIRTCLKLPSYIRTSLIHEYASIEPVKDRLQTISTKLLSKMKSYNEHIRILVDSHIPAYGKCHHSPLDALL